MFYISEGMGVDKLSKATFIEIITIRALNVEVFCLIIYLLFLKLLINNSGLFYYILIYLKYRYIYAQTGETFIK